MHYSHLLYFCLVLLNSACSVHCINQQSILSSEQYIRFQKSGNLMGAPSTDLIINKKGWLYYSETLGKDIQVEKNHLNTSQNKKFWQTVDIASLEILKDNYQTAFDSHIITLSIVKDARLIKKISYTTGQPVILRTLESNMNNIRINPNTPLK